MCGSDQIWSPYSDDVNSTFFLTFTAPSKRIALSPSLSADSIPEGKKAEFKSYLNGFEFISTREYTGSDLVFELTGNKAETLIDPTLMFDIEFWKNTRRSRELVPVTNMHCVIFLGTWTNDGYL